MKARTVFVLLAFSVTVASYLFAGPGSVTVPPVGLAAPSDQAVIDPPDSPAEGDANPGQGSAPPKQTSADQHKHEVGIGAKVGTLGIGGEVAVSLTERFNLRGGGNVFRLDRSQTRNGITYNAAVHLGNADLLLDWFPWANGFHLSPGLLVYNGNNISGSANVSGGKFFTLNNTPYFSSTANPVTGSATIGVNKVAPMILFGWGNLVPRTRHWSVSFEGGVAFWGSPKVTMALTGDVCDFGQTNCRAISADPTVQANINAQVAKYNSDASSYKVYPILSFGVGYKF